MVQEAHAFRGQFLDCCAKVERWACTVIQNERVQQASLLKSKNPHLFGQKLKVIEQLAEARPAIFAKPNRVKELFQRFTPYAKLRSELAHAIVVVTGSDVDSTWAFENAAGPTLPELSGRFWIKPDEAREMLSELRQVTKELCDQKVAKILNLSSPLPPGRAAGADP